MSYQLWKGKQIMKDYERLKMMEYPKDRIDLVIDTDAATEIDDQFAIAYALLSRERFHIRGIYAAPFAMNEKTKDPNVGMQMSYDEIVNIPWCRCIWCTAAIRCIHAFGSAGEKLQPGKTALCSRHWGNHKYCYSYFTIP